jgi:hypothetical protein
MPDQPDQPEADGSDRPAYKRRTSLVLSTLLLLAAVAVVGRLIHPGTSGSDDPGGSTVQSVSTEITVTGAGANGAAGGADVSYGGLTGTQSGHQDLPFTATITEGGPVSVVAQADEYTYSIGCTITRGGVQVASKDSLGQFAVVSCAG